MRKFSFGFKNTIVALTLSSLIVGDGGISPAVTDAELRVTTWVDRTHKGDRLPQVMRHHQSLNYSSTTTGAATTPHKRPPLGCDWAFSPISAPSLAHIFKRCMA